MAGAALCALELQNSWQAQHFGFVAGAALCALELQTSWQAQHVVNLEVQIAWRAGAALGEPRSADCVAGAALGEPLLKAQTSRQAQRLQNSKCRLHGVRKISVDLKTSDKEHLSTLPACLDP